jgi:hypothetical protein
LIETKSGIIEINKRTPYGKFVIGYTATHGWSGAQTLKEAWTHAIEIKNTDYTSISWEDMGRLLGNLQWNGVNWNLIES